MRSPKSQALLSRYSTLIIFLIPALTVFTLFVVLPIGEAAYYSFFRWNGYGDPEKYVGFAGGYPPDIRRSILVCSSVPKPIFASNGLFLTSF